MQPEEWEAWVKEIERCAVRGARNDPRLDKSDWIRIWAKARRALGSMRDLMHGGEPVGKLMQPETAERLSCKLWEIRWWCSRCRQKLHALFCPIRVVVGRSCHGQRLALSLDGMRRFQEALPPTVPCPYRCGRCGRHSWHVWLEMDTGGLGEYCTRCIKVVNQGWRVRLRDMLIIRPERGEIVDG